MQCGLTNWNSVTVPVTVTGTLLSYAAWPWCASVGTRATNNATTTARMANRLVMGTVSSLRPQNISLKPKRIERWSGGPPLLSSTATICPNVDEPYEAFGRSKCGLFNTLKTSTRNSPLIPCGNDSSLASVPSTLTYLGPSSTPLRGALPQVSGGGAEKTDGDVSNQSCPGPALP